MLTLQKLHRMKRIFALATLAFFSLIAFAFSYQAYLNWKIDSEKAMVKFSMQVHGQELIGNFKGARGNIMLDENNLSQASLSCDIDISTINTGIPDRDHHLQSKDFFDAASAPVANFTSTAFVKTPDGYSVTGKLSIKKIVKEITVSFVFTTSGEGGLFKGSFPIKRSNFQIGDADDEISDKVTISLEIPVVKAN